MGTVVFGVHCCYGHDYYRIVINTPFLWHKCNKLHHYNSFTSFTVGLTAEEGVLMT